MSVERSDNIDEMAGDWLARRDSGAWTEEDQRRFEQWLDESPLHRVAYLRIEHVWERSGRLSVLGAGIGRGAATPAHSRRGMVAGGTSSNSRRWLQRIAAGVLLALALGVGYSVWPPGVHYRTSVGGLASVPMSDGSTVTLNTDSEIRVSLTDTERRVELEQGEAFFEVAKDANRPFVVRAANKRVVAVGTKFSVRRDGRDIKVVVTEGKVRVETTDNDRTGMVEQLVAGTIARAGDAGVLLQSSALAQAEESLSWRQGVLVFHELTLAEASAEFNRYNTRKIVIEDPAVADLHVAGSFRANNVEAFVRLLERGYPLTAQEQDDRFVLRAR